MNNTSTFTEWLTIKPQAKDTTLSQLSELSRQNAHWPLTGQKKQDFTDAIEKIAATPEESRRLKEILEEAWARWEEYEASFSPDRAQPEEEKKEEKLLAVLGSLEKLGEWLANNVAGILVLVLVVSFGIILLSAFLTDSGVLTRVSNFEVARGSITFIFSTGTIILAVMLTAFSLFTKVSPAENELRFKQGKEVLTILIGILGTIVGFYFGSSNPSAGLASSASPAQFSVVTRQVTNPQPPPGARSTIVFQATGGSPPYTYTIAFNPDDILPSVPDEKGSDDGLIVHTIDIPSTITALTPLEVSASVSDGKGITAEATTTLTITPPQ